MTAVNWITSYPKSGNTWLRFMLVSYLTKEPVATASTSVLNTLIPPIGGLGGKRREIPTGEKYPVLLKTHAVPGASVLRPFRSDTSKAIYLVRNPRDVILSLVRHVGAEPGSERARELALTFIDNHGKLAVNAEKEWGSWPEHVQGWTTPAAARQHFPNVDVLVVRYEDMRVDPVAALHKIVTFLDLGEPVVADEVARAVESSSLDRMRALEERESGGESPVNPEATSPFRRRGQFVGHGRHGQSLARIGDDIEERYAGLVSGDNDFSRCARQFGYAS